MKTLPLLPSLARARYIGLGLIMLSLSTLCCSTALGDAAPRFGGVKPAAPVVSDSEPTAQGHLDNVQKHLAQALSALTKTSATSYGEYLPATQADVIQALADLKDAMAYVKAHPEENVLKAGPAPAETTKIRPTDIPSSNRTPGVNVLTAMEALNNALFELFNNPAADYHGPVLGELGGARLKLMEDINKASTDLLAGIKKAGALPQGRGGIFKAGNATPTPATSDDSASPSPTQTGVAGLALSLGLCFGGLHIFSRKRGSDDSAQS